jgi:LuxR family transcriptional regulator, maltose regulon positive regulatory protein
MIAGEQQLLLTTKIRLARPMPGLIERPRLLDLVDQVEAQQFTLIKGGAGFGKTTLAVSFANMLLARGHAVAWLALDADDNEAGRFLRYIVQALQRACGSCQAVIRLISDVSLAAPTTVVAALINELADIDQEIFLVLDDYQTIIDDSIHAIVAYLLKHAPRQFHLMVTSRVIPALALPGLRADNRLLEIDADALRFDADETRQFLQRGNIVAAAAQARIVHQKTEGWPALLRVFVSTPPRPGEDLAQRLQRLSGKGHPIAAYLEEMLDGLPRELVEAMLRTAIVDRFSAPLCQAITGAMSGERVLESMLSRQLLLAPLDQEGTWFRYHPILAEHLIFKLKSAFATEIPSLHRRAYRWFAEQKLWTEAVQHAIAAGDTHQAVAWVEHCAMDLVKQGDLLTLMDWQRLFPTQLMRGQVRGRLAIAWGMALAMRFDEALAAATELERDVEPETTSVAATVRTECETIRAVAMALMDDSVSALTIAQSCLRQSADPWTANVASNVARFGHLKAGDLKSLHAVPWIPYSQEEDGLNLFASVYRRCLLGVAEIQQLRLQTAERHCLDALDLAQRHMGSNSLVAALPASLLAQIRYEQGRLDEAEELLLDRLPLIYGAGMLECILSTGLVLTRIAEWRGNRERAYALLEEFERLGDRRNWDRLVAAALAERIRLHVMEGRIEESEACLDRLMVLAARRASSGVCAWWQIRIYASIAQAHLAVAQERAEEGVAFLRTGLLDAALAHDRYLALRLNVQLALAELHARRPGKAAMALRDAIAAAAPAGLSQTILTYGIEVGSLLIDLDERTRRTAADPQLLSCVQNVLARWRHRFGSDPRVSTAPGAAASLSARERVILAMIGEGNSNKEIARALEIAPETVKSHVKNIFQKLSVEKRAQAVARAQSLGLVATSFGDDRIVPHQRRAG